MTSHRQYKITDFRFGQMLLGFREKIERTQQEVADAMVVSKRTIQHWEAGTAFPDSSHLKNLIAYFLERGAFSKGVERSEALALWMQADESGTRRKSIFDEHWFAELLQRTTAGSGSDKTALDMPAAFRQHIDWADAPDVMEIFGREQELATLEEWVIKQQCRVVTVRGMGGIGKTTLVVKFAQEHAQEFDYVIWRSLRNAPNLESLLLECLQILSPIHEPEPSAELLLELLQQHRCLLMLDNVETLHRSGKLSGVYREGYEEYQSLFQKIAQTRHKSCLILTSREGPVELEGMEGMTSPIRLLKISGLTRAASQALLSDKGLFGASDSWSVFVHYYTGNPLALKIAANTVRDLFGGDLAAFLREAPATLHTLDQLLGNQFEQLSALERDILFWLSIERDPVDLDTLRNDFLLDIPNSEILSGLLSLRQRSLIERGEQGAVFHLLPVLLEFVTDRLISLAAEQMIKRNLEPIIKHALIKSQSIDHIRDSQVRMILQPVIFLLKRHFGSQAMIADHIRSLLVDVKRMPREMQGYAGGNLINLLNQLKANIKGEDFSTLVLRQTYLQGVDAQDADFSDAEFIDSRFTEPLETISAMNMSASGTYLAASTYDGHMRCWNITEGKPAWTVANASRAWSLAFSPDETLLACSHFRGQVSLRNVQTGRHVHTFDGHDGWVHTIAFHPNNRYLASGGGDAQLYIWDLTEKKLHTTLNGHTSRIWSAVFSPDGSLLASSGDEETIYIWEWATKDLKFKIQHPAKGNISLAFDPDGKWLAACCEQHPDINLWDPQTGELVSTIATRSGGPTSITFDPSGSSLVSGGFDGSVEIWYVRSGQTPQYIKRLMGHHNYVNVTAFSRNDLLATHSQGEDIRLWNVESGKLLRVFEGYSRLIGANAFSPDGKYLIQGDASGRIRVWDVAGRQYRSTIEVHTGPIWAIEFSPDGKTFATAGDDRCLRIWNVDSLHCIKTFPGLTERVWSLAFHPEGTVLATGGLPHGIRLWDTDPGAGIVEIDELGTNDDVWSLIFSPSGNELLSGHTNGTINVWDMKTGHATQTMKHGTIPIGALRFSADGNTLISSNNQYLEKFWNWQTGECIQTVSLPMDGNRTKAVAIGSDGDLIATGSSGSGVYIWDRNAMDNSGKPLVIEGHTSRVWTIALSLDGRYIASSDEEGTTLLSDVQHGTVVEKILIDRPYERMNIDGVTGLNAAEHAALKVLGAVETRS